MKLTVDELQENYDQVLNFINTTFSGDRKAQLYNMYDELGERLVLSPASSYGHFHSCYPGGYIVHVLNVLKFTKNMYKMWKMHGADMRGYTEEELMFAALNHDLGKIGDEVNEYYIPCESDWHIRNQGRFYETNPLIPNMRVAERSLYLLQHFGIRMSHNEYISIQIHDGLFEDQNDYYFKVMDKDRILKTNMPMILHQADYMAYRIEYEQWKKATSKEKYHPLKKEKSAKPEGADKKFDELFDKMTGEG